LIVCTAAFRFSMSSHQLPGIEELGSISINILQTGAQHLVLHLLPNLDDDTKQNDEFVIQTRQLIENCDALLTTCYGHGPRARHARHTTCGTQHRKGSYDGIEGRVACLELSGTAGGRVVTAMTYRINKHPVYGQSIMVSTSNNGLHANQHSSCARCWWDTK
jgi:hypothetical protein